MTVASIAMVVIVGSLAWPMIAPMFTRPPAQTTPAPQGNVGGQAPPQVRGTNPDPVAAPAIPTMPPGVAQNAATAQVMYDAAIRAASTAEPLKTAPVTLPVNSAGAPVIDAVQVQQQQQALELAAQEAQAALDSARATDVAGRAPDVSKADAEQMLHRDLCHVPRADPHTCEQGLYKPTPVQ